MPLSLSDFDAVTFDVYGTLDRLGAVHYRLSARVGRKAPRFLLSSKTC